MFSSSNQRGVWLAAGLRTRFATGRSTLSQLDATGLSVPVVRSMLGVKAGSELGDLADIEWALMEAFDGSNADPVGPNVMTGFGSEDWSYLRVVCLPTLTLLSCTSNAHEFWKSVKHRGSMKLTRALTTCRARSHSQVLDSA